MEKENYCILMYGFLVMKGGYYKAQWEEGKMISGEYFFKDELKY